MNQKDIFEKAYEELADPIFRYIYYRVFDRDIARELTQETFFKVWDYIAKGKKIDNIKAFIYRTAHNIMVNSIRNKKQTDSIEALEEEIGFEIKDTQQEETNTQISDIASILDSFTILAEKDAELMRLRYVDGLSIEEISKITRYSVSNISVKIHRLLERLKKYHNTP
jgi:RNA polymerase sigma-70 factor (ECF subfamily)